jgi:predicted transcriptional regulator
VVRAAAAIILRERGLSLKRIGRHLGFRHHWAVINYLRRADREPNKILPIVERARDLLARVERLRNESR